MTTFFDLPLEVRNIIYKLTLQGSRLRLCPQTPQSHAQPQSRTAFLYVSRQCHTEALAVLCSTVELDITSRIETSGWPSPNMSFPLSKLKHLVLDGRKRGFSDGAFILLFPKLSSLTLLWGIQYDIPIGVAGDATPSATTAIEVIRASPWRVLGTKFWRPRRDLKGVIEIWKERNKDFALKTEMEIMMGGVVGLWSGQFDLGTRTMIVWKNVGDASLESYDFPLEMLQL